MLQIHKASQIILSLEAGKYSFHQYALENLCGKLGELYQPVTENSVLKLLWQFMEQACEI